MVLVVYRLREVRMRVQRVLMPNESESWTVLDGGGEPVGEVEAFLAHLQALDRSPTTLRTYATSLKLWLQFLEPLGVAVDEATVENVSRFVGWLRAPAENVALLPYPWVGQKRHIAHYGFPARSDPSAPVDLPTSVVRRIPCGSGGPAIRGQAVACPRPCRQGPQRLRGQGRPQAVAAAMRSTLDAGGGGPVGSATPTPARGNRDQWRVWVSCPTHGSVTRAQNQGLTCPAGESRPDAVSRGPGRPVAPGSGSGGRQAVGCRAGTAARGSAG